MNRIRNIISMLLLAVTLSAYAQEVSKINREDFPSLERAVRLGNSYYKDGLYDAALEQYMKLYAVKKDDAALNYRIAVSHLYGVQPRSALAYFDQSRPEVAADYYCLRGIALIYHQRYGEAKEAFQQYSESLTPKQTAKEAPKIRRFIAICDFSATAVQDSLPAFVMNAGPGVNSYYDDYSAVEHASALYFTSRRPKDDNTDIASHSVFSERILRAPDFADAKTGDAEEVRLKSGKHLSVAGVDNNAGALLYYKGKKRFGDVYRTQFKETNGKTVKNKRLKKKVSRKTTAEGSIAVADNGDAYFISDRFGGMGGKDIWFAKKKGKRSFYRPQNLRSLNTSLNEESVFVSPDGNTLYFATNGLAGMGGFDIYRSERKSGSPWGEPVNMGYPVNGPDDDLYYRLTSDSTVALLSSKRSGGFGGLDIYMIRKDLRIPFEISGNVTDEKTGRSLAATVKMFDRTTNLPVATVANDTLQQQYLISMENTGNYYMTAEAPGYRAVTDSFTNPEVRHAKLQLNFMLEKLLHPYTLSGYVIDARSNRPVLAEVIIKPSGRDDILYRTVADGQSGYYTITMEDKENVDLLARATDYFDFSEAMPLKNVDADAGTKNISLQRSINTYTVTGTVNGVNADGSSAAPVKASVTASKAGDLQTVQGAVADDSGKYELTLTDTGPFLLEVTSEGYFFANSVLEFTGDSIMVIRNFTLKKMESGAKMIINNILFNTGKATLMPESFTELNKVVTLLKDNPTVRIEVSGHTDNVGSATTNRTLSRNRALTVRNYFISQGVAAERVEYSGYGFDRPVAPNNTAEGRAANRRVEMEILD